MKYAFGFAIVLSCILVGCMSSIRDANDTSESLIPSVNDHTSIQEQSQKPLTEVTSQGAVNVQELPPGDSTWLDVKQILSKYETIPAGAKP